MHPENFVISYSVTFIFLGSFVLLGIVIGVIVRLCTKFEKKEDEGVQRQELSNQAYAPVRQQEV